MEKTMNQKISYGLFFCDFIVMCFAFKSYCIEYYCNDAYSILCVADQGARFHLTNGRFILSLFLFLFNVVHINVVRMSVFFNLLYFFTVSLCINIVQKKLRNLFFTKEKAVCLFEEIFLNISLFIGYCNIFSAEWVYYNMCTIQFIISIFFATLSAVLFFHKKGFFLSLATLFVSYNSYQPGMGIFVWLLLLFVYLNSDGKVTKNCFFQIFGAVLICFINFILNLIILKLFIVFNVITSSERFSGFHIKVVCSYLKDLLCFQRILWFKGDGLTSFPLLFVFLVALFFLYFYSFFKNRETYYNVIYPVVLMLGGLLISFLPIMVMTFFWAAPRQLVPIFFLFTFILVSLLYRETFYSLKLKSLAIGICVFFISFTIYFIQIYAGDVLLTNKIDKQRSMAIKDAISDYEKSSGNIIQYIGFCHDKFPTWKYDLHLPYMWDSQNNMFMPEWSNLTGLNFYTYSTYVKIDVPQDIKNRASFKSRYKG